MPPKLYCILDNLKVILKVKSKMEIANYIELNDKGLQGKCDGIQPKWFSEENI